MLDDLAVRVSRLDRALAPIADQPVDLADPEWAERLRQAPPAVEQAGVADEAAVVLAALLTRYAEGDEPTRTAIRGLFRKHRSFQWGVGMSFPADTVERFRRHLLLLSARDQGMDTRDELLTLAELCRQASAAGVPTGPVLRVVAELSSDVDRYGMGSTRQILLSRVPGGRSGVP
ncbi:hypothetical protein [Plantactinospora endophytica]|uniref:Uncharacterized protein n=1 Tax=Plantactinospora endophytica TaxID=673535 RepID=A0ABQ4E2H9_9ACTN|nr:hypothetical protein [Plantactinospora endophytica]GIG88872.1 hypothetical protein Pen02_38080 [Plantactinospora endophytica]